MSTSEKSEALSRLTNRTSKSAKQRDDNRNHKPADAKRVYYFGAVGEAVSGSRVQGSLTWAPNLLDDDVTSLPRPLSAAEYVHSLHPVASFTPLKYGKMSDLDIHIASCLERRDGHRDLLAETMERMARVREHNERLKMETQRLKALIQERAARTIQIYWRLYRERLKEQRKQEKRKKSTWMETVRARRPPPLPRELHSRADDEEELEENGWGDGADAEGVSEDISGKTKKKMKRNESMKKPRATGEAAESPLLSPSRQESGAGENTDGAAAASKKSSKKKKKKKLRPKSSMKVMEMAPLEEDSEAEDEGAGEVPTEEMSPRAASTEGDGKPNSRRGKRKKGSKVKRKSRKAAVAASPHVAVDSDGGHNVLTHEGSEADRPLYSIGLGAWGDPGDAGVPPEVGLGLSAGNTIGYGHGESRFSEASAGGDDEYEEGDEECIYEDEDETEEEGEGKDGQVGNGDDASDQDEEELADGDGGLNQAEPGAVAVLGSAGGEGHGYDGKGTYDQSEEAAEPLEESPSSLLHAESSAALSNEATISGSGSSAVASRPKLRQLPQMQPQSLAPVPEVVPTAGATGNEAARSSRVRARSGSVSPKATRISAFQSPLPEASPKPRRVAYRPGDAAQPASRPAPRGPPVHAPPELRGATSQGASHHALMPLQSDARNIPSLLRVYDTASSAVSPTATMTATAPGSQAGFSTLPALSARQRAVSGNGYYTNSHSPTFYQLLSPRLALIRTGRCDDGEGGTSTGGGSEHLTSITLGVGRGARNVMSARRANATSLLPQHPPPRRVRSSDALMQHVKWSDGRPKRLSADAAVGVAVAAAAGAGVPDSAEGAVAAVTSLALNSPIYSESATTSSFTPRDETQTGGPEPILLRSGQPRLSEPQGGLWSSSHHGRLVVVPLNTAPSPGRLETQQVPAAVAAGRQAPPGQAPLGPDKESGLFFPLVDVTDGGATTTINGGSQSAPASLVRGAVVDAHSSLVRDLLAGVENRSAFATCRHVHYGRHRPIRKRKSVAAEGGVASGHSSGRGRARGRLQANKAALSRGGTTLSIVTLVGREGSGQGHAAGEGAASETGDLGAEFSFLSLRSQGTTPFLESERSAPALLQLGAPSPNGLPFRYRRDVLRQVFSQAQIHPAELMQRAMTPPRGVRGRTMVLPHPTLPAGVAVAAKQRDLTHIDLLDQARGLELLHHTRQKVPRRLLVQQAQLQQHQHRRPHHGAMPINLSPQPHDDRNSPIPEGTLSGGNSSGIRWASFMAGGKGGGASGLRDTDEQEPLGVVLEVGRQLAAREEAEQQRTLQQLQKQQLQQHYQHHRLSQQQQMLMSDGVNRWRRLDFEHGPAPAVGIVQGKGPGPSLQLWTLAADSCVPVAEVEEEGLRSRVAGAAGIIATGPNRDHPPNVLRPQLPSLPLTNSCSRTVGGLPPQTVGSDGGPSGGGAGGEKIKRRVSVLPSFTSHTPLPSLGTSGASLLVPLGPGPHPSYASLAPFHDESADGAAFGTSPSMPRSGQPAPLQHTLRSSSSGCYCASGSDKGKATDQGPFAHSNVEIPLDLESAAADAITPSPARSISPSAFHNHQSFSRTDATTPTIFWATSQLPHLRTSTSKHTHQLRASPHSQSPSPPPPPQQQQHLNPGQLQQHPSALVQLLLSGDGKVPTRLLPDMNSKVDDGTNTGQFGDLLAPTPWLQRLGGSNDAGTTTAAAAASQPSRPVILLPGPQLMSSTSTTQSLPPGRMKAAPAECAGPTEVHLMSSDGLAAKGRGHHLSGCLESSSRREPFSEMQPLHSQPGHVQQPSAVSPPETARFEGMGREASLADSGGLPSMPPPPTMTTRLVVRRPAPVLRLPVVAASHAAQKQQHIRSRSKLSSFTGTGSGALFTSGAYGGPSGSVSGGTVSRTTSLPPPAASCDGTLTLPTEQASYISTTPCAPTLSCSPEPFLLTMSTGMAQSGACLSIGGCLGTSSPEPWSGQPALPPAIASQSFLSPSYTTHSVLLSPEVSRASCVEGPTSPGTSGPVSSEGSKAALREWRGLERWWQAKGLGEAAGQFHKQPLTHTTRTVYL